MPVPTVSKLPELVIFGDLLPKSRFSAVSATVFYANRITGNIWPRVHGPQWDGAVTAHREARVARTVTAVTAVAAVRRAGAV